MDRFRAKFVSCSCRLHLSLAIGDRLSSLLLRGLLQLPSIPDTKAVVEDFRDIFERHSLHLRVTPPHSKPPEKANSGVEAKGAGWSRVLHLREKSAGNDHVGAPACAG